jgi:hypothetical protein
MKFFSSPLNWLIAFVGLLCIALVFIMMRNLDYRTEQCTEKKGTMVRTLEGWRCLDVRELKLD